MQNKNKHTSIVTTVTPVSPGIPRAAGFNGFLRGLPGEPGFVASVACGDHRKLDTSVGVSGRHDFAVRDRRIRLVRHRVHRIPRPTFCDDSRNAPLIGRGMCGNLLVICPTSQAKMPATHWHDGQIRRDCENPVK
jgi:hypothetical protein